MTAPSGQFGAASRAPLSYLAAVSVDAVTCMAISLWKYVVFALDSWLVGWFDPAVAAVIAVPPAAAPRKTPGAGAARSALESTRDGPRLRGTS